MKYPAWSCILRQRLNAGNGAVAGAVWIETCPLRPEGHGTERPLHNLVAMSRVALVEAARFLGGQLFVSWAEEIK